ncbi:MAG: hypothetical protein LBT55_06835 [Clostridiaceae bacterium]|jgi:hypothetical protein|nr:hypothetical protein [Clostridiaceae bacterium]
MELKNTTTLLFTNFKLVYRIIAYLFIIFLVVGAVSLSLFFPAQRHVLAQENVAVELDSMKAEFDGFISGEGDLSVGGYLSSTIKHVSGIIDVIKDDSGFVAAAIILIICLYFLGYFLISLIKIPLAGVLNTFMSSAVSASLLNYSIKDFKVSVKYAFADTVIGAPMHIVIMLVVYFIVALLFPVIQVFSLTLALLVAVVLLSLKSAIFAGWVPALIFSEDKKVWCALKNGFKDNKKRFHDIYGAFNIAIFAVYMLIAAFGLVTFGIMIVISFALLLMFQKGAELTFYYSTHGQRFYVDTKTVIDTRSFAERTELQEVVVGGSGTETGNAVVSGVEVKDADVINTDVRGATTGEEEISSANAAVSDSLEVEANIVVNAEDAASDRPEADINTVVNAVEKKA